MVEVAFEEARFWSEKLPREDKSEAKVTTTMMAAYKMLGLYKEQVIKAKIREREERIERKQQKKKDFEKIYKSIKKQRIGLKNALNDEFEHAEN